MRKKHFTALFAVLAMTVMILDTKTALQGTRDGVMLCIQTVIPSLFPFFFISGLINQSLLGYSGNLLKPVGQLCGIPSGAEPILLLGLSGGYPIGAQAIGTAYESGQICKQDAQRMLGFCSTAGPAFIFGMAGAVFDNKLVPWVIWGCLIVSSLLTGMLIPGKSQMSCRISNHSKKNPLEQSLKAMAAVCGWVILFRVLIHFLNRWFLWIFPLEISGIITGLLELTNGCVELSEYPNPAFTFIAMTGILAFGGICVGFQTASVVGTLSCKNYLKGKLMQTIFAVTIAVIFSAFLFPGKI